MKSMTQSQPEANAVSTAVSVFPELSSSAASNASDRQAKLRSIQASLGTQYSTPLTTLGQKSPLAYIPTGLSCLDTALGGGIPKGRVVEAFGKTGSGKTTLGLHCAAETQKAGGFVALIEPENSLDRDYAARLGVNLDEVLYSSPPDGNSAIQVIGGLIDANLFDLILLDSVAALLPKLVEGTFYAEDCAHAYMVSQGLRFLNNKLAQATRPCTLFFTNQLRHGGAVGGQALGFFASLRLDLVKGPQLKQGSTVIGSTIKVKVSKTKTSAPAPLTTLHLISGQGFMSSTIAVPCLTMS